MTIFNYLLSQPFALLMLLFNNYLWVPVLIYGLLTRLFLWPVFNKLLVEQEKMKKIQPQLTALQQKYKNDAFGFQKEFSAILKTEKINPYFTFLFLFGQIFILIIFLAFFNSIISAQWVNYLLPALKNNFAHSFLQEANYFFFGFDLRQPNFLLTLFLAILNSFAIIFQIKKQNVKNKTEKKIDRQQLNANYFSFFLSFLILIFYQRIPLILIIYWLGFSLVSLLQEMVNFVNFQKSLLNNH